MAIVNALVLYIMANNANMLHFRRKTSSAYLKINPRPQIMNKVEVKLKF